MNHIDYLRIYDIQKQASVELWFNKCAGWEIEKKGWKLVKVVLISPFVWTNLYLLVSKFWHLGLQQEKKES